MTSGWRIGTIFGIPLLLNPTWFYSLGLFAFFFSSDWEQADLEPAWAWLAGLVMALLLFASVLLHELGHSVVAQSQGIEVSAITLFPFGGIASISQESKTPNDAFRVAIAGPAVSFALFLLLFLLSFGLPEASPIKTMLSYLAGINLVLALFNMLPGLPLDGGQVLKAVIWQVTGSRITGIRFAAQTGELLGWAAIGVGMAGFLSTLRFSFLWLVLLGWFGIRRAIAYRRQTTLQKAMLQLQVVDAMRTDLQADLQADDTNRIQPLLESSIVTEFASLAEAIDQLEAQQLDQLFVLSPVGAVIGVIDRADIVQALGTQLNLSVPETVLQQIKADGQFPSNLQLQSVARDALK